MRQRLEVHAPDALVEDADGVHVILYTAVDVDYPRRLPLEYGANRVSRLERCSCCVLRDSGPDFRAVGVRFTVECFNPFLQFSDAKPVTWWLQQREPRGVGQWIES